MTRSLRLALIAVALLSTAALVVGFVTERQQAAFSYLFAFFSVLSTVVGTLFLLMIGHASNAGWFVPLRRHCERVVGVLPFLALGIAPVLVLAEELYPWVHPHDLSPLVSHHVEKKLVWLNSPFFTARSIAYMGLFVLFSELLYRKSVRQDSAREPQEATRQRRSMVKLAVGGLVALGLVISLAAWDWLMSLEPAWYSNLYGVYIFTGGLLAALGLLGVMTVLVRGRGGVPKEVHADHYHAVGRLQLALVIFWAYMAWCHLLQQWIANIPVEHLWHLRRWRNGWEWQGITLLVVQFALPFLALLSRPAKRHPETFVLISTWLVLAHAVDIHYLVLPALHPRGPMVHWLDVVALAAVASTTVLLAELRGRHVHSVPVKDPLRERGLNYESQA